MPRYDYECDTCHHIFELKQSFDSEPVATCPNCENSARRKFHAVPIVFKGSGWYVNDYGKRSNNNTNESAESKESSGSDSSSKSESKSGTESKESSDTSSKSESTTSSTAKTESTPAKSTSE